MPPSKQCRSFRSYFFHSLCEYKITTINEGLYNKDYALGKVKNSHFGLNYLTTCFVGFHYSGKVEKRVKVFLNFIAQVRCPDQSEKKNVDRLGLF